MSAPLSQYRSAWITALQDVSELPERECQWIIEHSTGLDAGAQRRREVTLTVAQAARVTELIRRRAAGEPLAYVLGTQPFWTLELAVTPAVLIPRPETELLVRRALQHGGQLTSVRVADLGTGSGAIALALAHERPQWSMVATDLSEEALAVARDNARRLGLSNIHFAAGDWCAALPAGSDFDLIISNPPYIADDDPEVAMDVRTFEPHRALFAGHDGLAAARQIIVQSPAHLRPGGWLLLEHGWQQASAVRALLESAGWVGVASHADLAGLERVTEAQRPTS